jgi:DNA-binding transcriptional regulator YhcF (GntR family)
MDNDIAKLINLCYINSKTYQTYHYKHDMNKKPSQLFIEWIEERIQKGPPGSRLPTDPQIATRFGISVITVHRLVQRFANSGRIVRIQGKGTFIGPLPSPSEVPATVKPTFQSTADLLLQLISTGACKTGQPLPSAKFLRLQFHISPAMARQAFRSLERMGFATRVGRNYFAGSDFESVVRSRGRIQVVVCNPLSDDFGTMFIDDAFASAYQRMERDLLNAGAGIRYVTAAELNAMIARWSSAGDMPQGLVFFRMDDQLLAPLRSHLSLLMKKAKGNPPRLLMDWVMGDFSALPSKTLILSRGNIQTVAARTLARHIFSQGHRSVRFCFDDSLPVWQAYMPKWTVLKIRGELSPFSDAISFDFMVQSPQRGLSFEKYLGSIPPEHSPQQPLDKHKPTPIAMLKNEMLFTRDAAKELTRANTRPLWICSTSRMATAVLERAKSLGMAVPHDISILCLENDPHYLHHGFSYCGPDFDRIGYLMAHAIIGDIPIAKTTLGFIKTAGMIVEKLTTRG